MQPTTSTTITSATPLVLTNPVFVKRICLFAALTPVKALKLTRGVNSAFQESMVVYKGFVESLININAITHAVPGQNVPGKFLVNRIVKAIYAKHFGLARWIVVELRNQKDILSGAAASASVNTTTSTRLKVQDEEKQQDEELLLDSTLALIVMGKYEDEIIACLKVLCDEIGFKQFEYGIVRRLYIFEDHLTSTTYTTFIWNYLARTGKTEVMKFLFSGDLQGDLDASSPSYTSEAMRNACISHQDSLNRTSVYFSITSYQMKVIRLLQSLGADFSCRHQSKLKKKQTPFMLALQHYPHYPEMARLLLSQFFIQSQDSSLHEDDDESIINLKTELEATDANGWKPLHYAVNSNAKDIVIDLILKGRVDLNATTSDGRSAFFIATQRNYSELAGLLIFFGARTEGREGLSISPFALFTGFDTVENRDRVLQTIKILFRRCCCSSANAEKTNTWNLLRQVDDASKRTLLHRAASENNFEAVVFIVDKMNLDVNAQDAKGDTALHLVLKQKSVSSIDPKIIKFLVDRGAKNNNEVSSSSSSSIPTLVQTCRTNLTRSLSYQSRDTVNRIKKLESALNYINTTSSNTNSNDEKTRMIATRPKFLLREIVASILGRCVIPNIQPVLPHPRPKSKEISARAFRAKQLAKRQVADNHDDSSFFPSFVTELKTIQERRSFLKEFINQSLEKLNQNIRQHLQREVGNAPKGKVPIQELYEYHKREMQKLEADAKFATMIAGGEGIEGMKKMMLERLEAFDLIDRKLKQVGDAIADRKCFFCVLCEKVFDNHDELVTHSSKSCSAAGKSFKNCSLQ